MGRVWMVTGGHHWRAYCTVGMDMCVGRWWPRQLLATVPHGRIGGSRARGRQTGHTDVEEWHVRANGTTIVNLPPLVSRRTRVLPRSQLLTLNFAHQRLRSFAMTVLTAPKTAWVMPHDGWSSPALPKPPPLPTPGPPCWCASTPPVRRGTLLGPTAGAVLPWGWRGGAAPGPTQGPRAAARGRASTQQEGEKERNRAVTGRQEQTLSTHICSMHRVAGRGGSLSRSSGRNGSTYVRVTPAQ